MLPQNSSETVEKETENIGFDEKYQKKDIRHKIIDDLKLI